MFLRYCAWVGAGKYTGPTDAPLGEARSEEDQGTRRLPVAAGIQTLVCDAGWIVGDSDLTLLDGLDGLSLDQHLVASCGECFVRLRNALRVYIFVSGKHSFLQLEGYALTPSSTSSTRTKSTPPPHWCLSL